MYFVSIRLRHLAFFALLLLTPALESFPQEDETAKVSGQVLNYFGDPLEGAEVSFYLLERKTGEYVGAGKLMKAVETNPSGKYQAGGLPPGEYRVEVGLFGFPRSEVWRFYVWRKAERVLDFGLKIGITHGLPLLSVGGTIRELDGKPISGATVTLTNAFDLSEPKQTLSDNKGAYRFELIQPGQYVVTASNQGFMVASSTLVVGARPSSSGPIEVAKKVDLRLAALPRDK